MARFNQRIKASFYNHVLDLTIEWERGGGLLIRLVSAASRYTLNAKGYLDTASMKRATSVARGRVLLVKPFQPNELMWLRRRQIQTWILLGRIQAETSDNIEFTLRASREAESKE